MSIRFSRVWAAALLVLLLAAGCAQERDLAGDYAAQPPTDALPAQVGLTLNPDGTGQWRVQGGESVYFQWETRGEDVWLHTRDGGLIQARETGQGLRMDLPGVGRLEFVRTES
jgi:hypothetical protein